MLSDIVNKVFLRLNNYIYNIYSLIFSRKIFYRYNLFVYKLSLSGLGINLSVELESSGEKKIIRKLLTGVKSPVIFDVGANIGEYSKMVRELFPESHIYSFEPHPVTFLKLKESEKEYKLNIYNTGMGEFLKEMELFDYKSEDGSPRASLYKDVIERQYNSSSVAHKVNISTIDIFSENNNIENIDLLKIDVEGNELSVLRGAKNMVKENKIKIIQFEFNYTNIISRTFLTDFFDELNNYSFYRILRKGMAKIDYLAINEIFQYQNLIAINNNIHKLIN